MSSVRRMKAEGRSVHANEPNTTLFVYGNRGSLWVTRAIPQAAIARSDHGLWAPVCFSNLVLLANLPPQTEIGGVL